MTSSKGMPGAGLVPASVGREAAPVQWPRVDSRVLLAGADRVLIEHRGDTYVLRLTRQDKLILTKQ